MVEWIGIDALMESLEVMTMAYDASRHSTGDHLRTVWDGSLETLREEPVAGLFHCAVNNTRHTVKWLSDMVEISRDTLDDLSRVNQSRRDRIRLIDR